MTAYDFSALEKLHFPSPPVPHCTAKQLAVFGSAMWVGLSRWDTVYIDAAQLHSSTNALVQFSLDTGTSVCSLRFYKKQSIKSIKVNQILFDDSLIFIKVPNKDSFSSSE